MNKINKAVLAVGVAVMASGCVHPHSLDQSPADAAARPAETQPQATPTLRPMQSYGALGGYRYRRFTGV